jgi:hypothetical protein
MDIGRGIHGIPPEVFHEVSVHPRSIRFRRLQTAAPCRQASFGRETFHMGFGSVKDRSLSHPAAKKGVGYAA